LAHDERYQIRNAEIEKALRTLAVLIEEATPPGWGFGLFLVPFGAQEPALEAQPLPAGTGKASLALHAPKGAVFWISNSDRPGMIDAIRGWMDEQDKRRRI